LLQASETHRTNHCFSSTGYGAVLTAACARQGCSASGLVWFGMSLAVFVDIIIYFINNTQEEKCNEYGCLLGCCTMQSVIILPTFRMRLLPVSSGLGSLNTPITDATP
jgi:hypothetical protein